MNSPLPVYFEESVPAKIKDLAVTHDWQPASGATSGILFTYRDGKLGLLDLESESDLPVEVDFLEPGFLRRLSALDQEQQLIKKAIGLKPSFSIKVLDATAGWGRDAVILAAIGYRVLSVEKSLLVFLLLEDAYLRLSSDPERRELASRLRFFHADSIELMTQIGPTNERPDVVYLDPMFPEAKKNALPKKPMQILRKILGPEKNVSSLIESARGCARLRVVLKNHPTNETIGAPNHSLESKAVRYDIFLVPQANV